MRQSGGNDSLLYSKISAVEQVKGVLLEAREEHLLTYCMMNGVDVGSGDSVREEDVTAKRYKLQRDPRTPSA